MAFKKNRIQEKKRKRALFRAKKSDMQQNRSFSFRTPRTQAPVTKGPIRKPAQTQIQVQTQVEPPKVQPVRSVPVVTQQAQQQSTNVLQAHVEVAPPPITKPRYVPQTLDSIFDQPITEEESRSPGIQLMGMIAKKGAVKPVKKDKPKLERVLPNEEPQCVMISQMYSKDVLPNEEDRDMLRWPVPRPNGDIAFNLCFFVREVQRFIVDNEKITQEQTETLAEVRVCPMFAKDAIQTEFDKHKLEYVVPNEMDVDFRSVFLEYDLMPKKTKMDNDPVTSIVIEKLQGFIAKSNTDTNIPDDLALPAAPSKDPSTTEAKSYLQKMSGFFWYATKKTFNFISQVLVMRGAKIALWMLNNPMYARIIFYVVKAVRIALCIKTSFPVMTEAMLHGLMNRIREVTLGYGQVIINMAENLMACATAVANTYAGNLTEAGKDAVRCSLAVPGWLIDTIKHYTPQWLNNFLSWGNSFMSNTLWKAGEFLSSAGESILNSLGCPVVFKAFEILTGAAAENSDVLGLGKIVTTNENIRLAFKSWTPDIFNFNVILMLLDIAVTVIDILNLPNTVTSVFVNTFIARIPIVGPQMAQSIDALISVTVGLGGTMFNPLRWVLVQIRRLANYQNYIDAIYAGLYEIYEWFVDLFPCLLKYVGDKLLSLVTFGAYTNVFVTSGDNLTLKLEPTCCMTGIIRELQRHFVFGELDRQINVRAQSVKQERSDVGWFDYAKSFVIPVDSMNSVLQHEQQIRDERSELLTSMYKHGGPIRTSYTTRDFSDTLHDIYGDSKRQEGFRQAKLRADNPGGKAFVLDNPINKVRTRGRSSSYRGFTETMVVTTNVIGIPCVLDDHIQKIRIVGMERDLPFRGGVLRFYLCVDDDGSVRWHLSRKDMMARFPNDVVYGDVDKLKVVLPTHLFSMQEQMFLADVPIMVVRL